MSAHLCSERELSAQGIDGNDIDIDHQAERIANGLKRYAELHIRIRQLDNELAALTGVPWIWGDE